MKFTRKRVLRLVLAVTIVAALVVFVSTESWDLGAIRAWMLGLNPALLIVLMAVLPVVGFSVALVYLVAGAAFGGIAGFAVITAVTAFHLTASHWLGRKFFRRPVERFLKKRKVRVPEIPPGEEREVTLLILLTPGLPYFVRNYVLALSHIPGRTYFWIAWPIYVMRSCVTLYLGDYGAELNRNRLLILGAIFVVKLGICAFLVYHVRRRYLATHRAPPREKSAG